MNAFRDRLLWHESGLTRHAATTDGLFARGRDGISAILSDRARSAEYILYEDGRMMCHVPSSTGPGAYYPVPEIRLERPVRAVLMDLDGTTVHSEPFWVWIIEQSVRSLTGDAGFAFTDADLPHVSGHSVSEHLMYCIHTYCPTARLEDARALYFEHTRREMALIAEGKGRGDAFVPTPGIGEFLHALKARDIKIALVTSGLYEKAAPEIRAAFHTLGLDAPEAFYDCIISAGSPLGQGDWGTLGELTPKPHPWLYAEAARVGLGIPYADRASVVGIEDSAVGIHAIRLAGYTALGVRGGNIEQSGATPFADAMFPSFGDLSRYLFDQ
ncbi:HAD family phosphatase [Eubacteriales bacterium OttesenSCG-928-A19]|nr:HAD family phosphatase [Eubacteriales bacterium OttesenSCG-928-A19]